MKTPGNILIVGAGASGLVLGYHLNHAGAKISYFVRSGRVAELKQPQLLYCYDDNTLKTCSNYELIDDINTVADIAFDYVIVTLDGYSTFSEEGTALLQQLGKAIANTQAVVISIGVGVGIRDHYLSAMSLPDERLVCGTVSFLSHPILDGREPIPGQTIPSSVDTALLSQARYAYRHPGNKGGVVLNNANPQPAKRFAELYNRCGVSSVQILNATLLDVLSSTFFALYAAGMLAGWPPVAKLAKDTQYWPVACRAAKEIARLPRFGVTGKVMSLFLTPWAWKKILLDAEKSSEPLDNTAFNRFHHGEKVMAQDIQILRDNFADGERRGLSMPNLQQLLVSVDERLSSAE